MLAFRYITLICWYNSSMLQFNLQDLFPKILGSDRLILLVKTLHILVDSILTSIIWIIVFDSAGRASRTERVPWSILLGRITGNPKATHLSLNVWFLWYSRIYWLWYVQPSAIGDLRYLSVHRVSRDIHCSQAHWVIQPAPILLNPSWSSYPEHRALTFVTVLPQQGCPLVRARE